MPRATEPITIRIGGKTIKDAIARDDGPALEAVSKAIIVASRLANTARARMKKGDFVGVANSYAVSRGDNRGENRKKRFHYHISKSYAEALGLRKTWFRDSWTFHKGINATPGIVTGGMLKGMRVRNYGIKGAVIEFAGKSLGSRTKKRKRGGRNERVMVANRKKARQVWWRMKINPAQPSAGELEALGSATTLLMSDEIADAMNGKPGRYTTNGDAVLIQRIMGDIRRGVPISL